MPDTRNTLATFRSDARSIFSAGLNAVDPHTAVMERCRRQGDRLFIGKRCHELSRYGNVWVIGAGKATAPMAYAMERLIGDRISGGIINVKYGHTAELNRIRMVEAGHPIPDENGRQGTSEMLKMASQADRNDLIICLISGGGSALLPMPSGDLTLEDKQHTSKILIDCGASIHAINAIRKHCSNVKGGHLARAAFPATLVSLILSDVVGDDLDVIASGPCVPDSTTYAQCLEIIDRFHIAGKLPAPVVRHLGEGARGDREETPKEGDPAFERSENVIIGSNMDAILAARKHARTLGYNTLILSSMIEGETRHVARVHTAIAKEILNTGHPIASPACILSGGETTVTIAGDGMGGRNQEFALAAAMDMPKEGNVVLLCGGTDGTDGPTDAAGAVADSTTVDRAAALQMSPYDYLTRNDAYHFFKPLGDLLLTGPTNTNVMDIRVMLAGH